MIIGFIAAYIWVMKIDIQLDENIIKTSLYYQSKNMSDMINKRIESISKNNINENKLPFTSSMPPEQETQFLKYALENHNNTMKENENSIGAKIGEELKIANRADVRIAALIYIATMTYLTLYGFILWHRRIQVIDDKIKERSLEKLELEIEKLKQAALGSISTPMESGSIAPPDHPR